MFLADRLPTRAAPTLDLDPSTGRARLSYRRAAAIFAERTGWSLHQLRHSALIHRPQQDGQAGRDLRSRGTPVVPPALNNGNCAATQSQGTPHIHSLPGRPRLGDAP